MRSPLRNSSYRGFLGTGATPYNVAVPHTSAGNPTPWEFSRQQFVVAYILVSPLLTMKFSIVSLSHLRL